MAQYLPNGWVLTDDGYYVGGDGTNIKHTPAQYQQIETMRSQAAAYIPIQYDEAGTRLTPDNVNAGTPQQLGAMQWAQQQQQPANLGGLLSGPNVQNFGISPTGEVSAPLTYSSGAGGNFMSEDAQAYFNRYPDLLPAYQANSLGLNPTQWAQTHFNKFGQGEQRTWGATSSSPLPTALPPPANTVYQQRMDVPKVDLSPINKQNGTTVPGLQDIRNQVGGTTPSFQTAPSSNSGTTMLGWMNGTSMETTQPNPQYAPVQDTSAWRAAPSALTPLQQGGRGMLYS